MLACLRKKKNSNLYNLKNIAAKCIKMLQIAKCKKE
jgi:hypothetical protein